MKKVQKYIEEKLSHISVSPNINLDNMSLEDFIYQKITTKKFRKYALPEGYEEVIKNIVKKAIENQEPINLVWVFGGYKLWSLEESPEVDWSELFSILYFIEWLKPVVSLHKPGVVFDFFSDDVIIPLMNDVPKGDVKKYVESFKKLLKFIKPNLPSGFEFDFNRVEDQYATAGDFKKELQSNILKLTKERGDGFDLTPQQIAMIEMNVILTDSQKKDKNWRQKVQIIHDSYSLSSKRRPYYRNTDKIMVVNTALSGAIAVGTTKSSVAKFWVGIGVLEEKGSSFRELVLSPSQIKKSNFEKSPIKIKGLEGKNFTEIKVKIS